jgi:iron complex outermembrane receptor protein
MPTDSFTTSRTQKTSSHLKYLNNKNFVFQSLTVCTLLTLPFAVNAEQPKTKAKTATPTVNNKTPITLGEMTVTTKGTNQGFDSDNGLGLHLDASPSVASRLGLTIRETPATVNVITQEQMQQQGIRNLIEAYISAPGVSAGNLPGEPGVTSMRGFSRAATGYMVDGMRVIDSLLVSRNFDSWSFERIEILKGPSSVLHGTGALAGAINLVTKKPSHEKRSFEGILSYGSFDTLRVGVGGNTPFGDTGAVRANVIYNKSGGYINDTGSNTLGITTGVSFKPTDRLSLSADFDYFHDHFDTAYQGAPLLPSSIAKNPSGIVSTTNGYVLDKSISKTNYNVNDGIMTSDNFWVRTNADYKLTDNWHLINEAGYFHADRLWANSEDFTYNAKSRLLDRTTTLITHNQDIWSERVYANFDGNIFQHHNRFVSGFEYINTQLDSNRRFGAASSVNPFAPVRSNFPADTKANFSTRQDFGGSVDTVSGFMEDSLNLTTDWLAITGLRFEHSKLERNINDLNAQTTTSFGRGFDALSWRFGSVYNVTKNTQIYGQYSRAVSPVSSLLVSSSQRAAFKLTTGDSFEAGFKSSFWDDRVTLTTAFYHITQDDILTRDPANPQLTVQGGSQRSRGIETDLSLALTPQWRVNANAAFLDAEFTQLLEAGGADRSGKTPPNVPSRTFNVSTFYTLPSIPLTFGAIVRNSGNFYTDNANTIKVAGHTLLDLSLSYQFKNIGTLKVQGRNMTNEFYANWSGYSATQVYIGAPRSVDVTWTTAF